MNMAFGIISPLESPSRSLTSEEIALAQSIFGNAIVDYNKVRIYSSKAFIWQPDGVFITPNGNIYDPTGTYLFGINVGGGGATLAQKALFIHEMTHVWQDQYYAQPTDSNDPSPDFVRARLADSSYDYSAIFSGTAFKDLGVEKQAAFLEDYFKLSVSPGGSTLNGKFLEDYSSKLPINWQSETYPVVPGGIRVQEQYNGDEPIQVPWSWLGSAQSQATIDGQSYLAKDVFNSLSHAATAIGNFIQDQVNDGIAWFTDANGANVAFAQWLGANMQSLVNGTLDPDDAFVDLAEYLGSQYGALQLSQFMNGGDTATAAHRLLATVFHESFGVSVAEAGSLATSFNTALSRFAIDFAVHAGSWTASDYSKAGITAVSGVVAQHYATKFFSETTVLPSGQTIIWNPTSAQAVQISGTVAVVANIVATLLSDPNLNTQDWIRLGLTSGLAYGTVSIGSTAGSAIANALSLGAGAAISYIGGKILGGLYGGAEFGPGEFPSKAQLIKSVYSVQQVDDGNGHMVNALVATNPKGSVILLKSNITHAVGGAGSDTLVGDGSGVPTDNVMSGAADDDYLEGRAGNDALFGDAGHDHMLGGLGDDIIIGGDGPARVCVQKARAALAAHARINDEMFGDEGADTMLGDAGDDFIHAGSGDDAITGGAGNDIILASAGADAVDGGDGRDIIELGAGDDKGEGGAGPARVCAQQRAADKRRMRMKQRLPAICFHHRRAATSARPQRVVRAAHTIEMFMNASGFKNLQAVEINQSLKRTG